MRVYGYATTGDLVVRLKVGSMAEAQYQIRLWNRRQAAGALVVSQLVIDVRDVLS